MEITGAAPERHVAVFAFPFSSHPPLLLSLLRRLATAAPTVTFSFFNTAKSNRALFSDAFPENIRPYHISDGIPADYVFAGNPLEAIDLFLAVAEEEFRRCVKAAEDEVGLRVGCVVADAFLWFSGEMAEEMKVPWVAFWTAGACSLSTHFYTDLIRQNIGTNGLVGREEEIVDFIPGFPAVRIGDLQGGIVSGNLESPFSTMLHKMGRTLPKASAIAINSFEELDPDITQDLTSKFKIFLNIGPFNLMFPQKPPSNFDEFSCISWLDSQKAQTVAYICFGTVVRPPPHELIALAEALEERKIPFLWSINDDSNKHLVEGFLEKTDLKRIGKVVSWAPQVQVLAHCAIGVFVTHGGWNSVLESIGAGVPMIGRPFFGDQQINTWMVENVWGIGTKTEGGVFTKLGTSRVLEQVFSLDGSRRKLKERSTTYKELAHKAVVPNGSSSQNFKTLLDLICNKTD